MWKSDCLQNQVKWSGLWISKQKYDYRWCMLMWMDSVSHMDHHKHTSDHLLVVHLMELLTKHVQFFAVLVILVTLTTLLHIWERTAFVIVLKQTLKIGPESHQGVGIA